jgi:general secretion pathway protein L
MAQTFTTVFIRWWVEQLLELVPPNWLSLFAKSSDAAILEIHDGRFGLWTRREGAQAHVAEGSTSVLPVALGSVTKLPHLLLLRMSPEQALCKKLSFPNAARRDLKTLLGFEIDRETPFEQGEVYWNYIAGAADKTRGKFDLDLVVVPRAHADAAVAAAREAGFDPAALEIEVEPGKPVLIWIAPQRQVHKILSYRKLGPLAAVTGGLAAAFIVLSFIGQQWDLYIANQTIAELQSRAHEASALRSAADHRLAAVSFFSRTGGANGSALGILAAATRALPDNTYLTSFAVHEGRVTMSGFSGSAASLIGLLEKSSLFRDPVFDTPLTQTEGNDQEKFTISANLAPMDPS